MYVSENMGLLNPCVMQIATLDMLRDKVSIPFQSQKRKSTRIYKDVSIMRVCPRKTS